MMDERLEELVTRVHFDAEIRRLDDRLERVELRLDRVERLVPEVRLLTWVQGVVIAALLIPQLQGWFGP
jgi:hypothetical protein